MSLSAGTISTNGWHYGDSSLPLKKQYLDSRSYAGVKALSRQKMFAFCFHNCRFCFSTTALRLDSKGILMEEIVQLCMSAIHQRRLYDLQLMALRSRVLL